MGKGIESAGDFGDVLILDKTGTVPEGSRSAVEFVPMQNYTVEDVDWGRPICFFYT